MIDKIIYIIFSCFGSFFIFYSIPLLAKGSISGGIGTGTFPFVLSIIITILSLTQLFKKSEVYPILKYKNVFIIVGVLIVFITLWTLVNFYIILPILILLLMRIFNIFTWKSYIIFTFCVIGVIYSLFSLLLKVSL